MNLESKKNRIIGVLAISLITLIGIFLFDHALALGLILLTILMSATSFAIWKLQLFRKELFFLILIVLVVHVGAVLFINYADFQPFSGGTGDYTRYHAEATEIASRLHQGNFSLDGVGVAHVFPVIIGYVYALTTSAMIIGQLFNVWLSVLAIIFLYFIIIELYNSPRWGLIIGSIGALHPSFIFFSSLLLKDVLVIVLAMASVFFLLKLLKKFSFKYFLLFYLTLSLVIHVRFYVGFVLAAVFVLAWLFLSSMTIKKRVIYALFLIPVLGTAPQISGYGYLGAPIFFKFLNVDRIAFYKEQIYQGEGDIGKSSSYKIIDKNSSFLENSSRSLSFAFFGPFPWNMKYKKHLFVLIETIPWYFLYLFIATGVYASFRRHRKALPLFLFSMATIGLLALFFSNFGIISRIRIPAMLLLLGFLPLSPIWQKLPKSITRFINIKNGE